MKLSLISYIRLIRGGGLSVVPYFISIVGSFPRWHCIRSMQSPVAGAACPTDMKGIRAGLENLCGDTKSIIEGRNVFAEFVTDTTCYIL